MKREVIRREAVKLRFQGKTYKKIIEEIKLRFNFSLTRMSIYRWTDRVLKTDWNFKDISQRPKVIHYKFSKENKLSVIDYRKKQGYSANKIRVHLKEKSIFMSESTIKLIIKGEGLSNGNKMEGIKLKWVRFERENPNSMWQVDGTELQDGTWLVLVEDDCSRYCIGAMIFDTLTTDNMKLLLEECINMHGKPREILTDNGHEFGGIWKDSQFDKWCEMQGIIHIRTSIHKPTTLGKMGALQQTYFREISYCNNDLEAWRYRYNHERPHESLRMLAPAIVFFQFRRHKKHYEL